MSEKAVETYYKCKNTIEFFLTWSGLWPDYKKNSPFYLVKLFLVAYSFMTSITISYGTMMYALRSLGSSNVIGMSKGFGICLASFAINVRIIFMLWHEKKFKNLINKLSTDFHESMKIPEYHTYLFERLGLLYNICLFVKWACFLHFVPSITSVLISVFVHGKYTTSMFPLAFPWDPTLGGINFATYFAIELSFALFAWLTITGVDMSIGLCVMYYVGEVKLLAHRMKNFRISNNYQEYFKSLVIRHSELMNYHHTLEDVYGMILLYVIIVCAINTCITVYQATFIAELGIYKMVYFVIWFAVKLVQSYFYTYVGDLVTEENENCIDAIYETDWADQNEISFRKDMLILLSQSALHFKATPMLYVNLTVFIKTLNTAMSCYCILRTLEQNARSD